MQFENEGLENSDVSQESSSETQEAGSQQQAPIESAEQTQQQSSEKSTPFHEHPRWKEMLEDRNTARQQAEALQKQYQDLQSRFESLSKPKEPTVDKRAAMIERLKGIDPDFADFVSQLAPTQELQSLQEQLKAEKEQMFVQSAVSTVREMHSKNAVPQELQSKYEQELDYLYRTGKIRSQADVQSAYKSIHEGYSKLLESIKRSERESYVAAKKTDVKTPSSQPKGKSVPTEKKAEWSSDPEARKAEAIRRVMNIKKASDSL